MPEATTPQARLSDTDVQRPPPPPGIGRQMAQLVVIPALITVACVTVALLFGALAGRPDSLDEQLRRLRQSSGAGRMALGLQDPRYKDRGLAAANIAQMLPRVADPIERDRIARELMDIFNTSVGPEEDLLRVYLLLAIGQLGPQGGLELIVSRLDSPRTIERQGAIRGLLTWPRPEEARLAVPMLVKLLTDREPTVATQAAAALGALAPAGDQAALTALRSSLTRTSAASSEDREITWNAAVALARLDDAQGASIVADLLLRRDALVGLGPVTTPAGTPGSAAMSLADQDRVILSTLAASPHIRAPVVWQRISELAADDLSPRVRKTAHDLIAQRQKQASEAR